MKIEGRHLGSVMHKNPFFVVHNRLDYRRADFICEQIKVNSFGVNCVTAKNGKEAVEQCQTSSFNLVIMDCQMPIMDGYEATSMIRKLELKHQPIILAMTANAMVDDQEKCLKAGMDDYLSKPINRAKLREKLTKWNRELGTNRRKQSA